MNAARLLQVHQLLLTVKTNDDVNKIGLVVLGIFGKDQVWQD